MLWSYLECYWWWSREILSKKLYKIEWNSGRRECEREILRKNKKRKSFPSIYSGMVDFLKVHFFMVDIRFDVLASTEMTGISLVSSKRNENFEAIFFLIFSFCIKWNVGFRFFFLFVSLLFSSVDDFLVCGFCLVVAVFFGCVWLRADVCVMVGGSVAGWKWFSIFRERQIFHWRFAVRISKWLLRVTASYSPSIRRGNSTSTRPIQRINDLWLLLLVRNISSWKVIDFIRFNEKANPRNCCDFCLVPFAPLRVGLE